MHHCYPGAQFNRKYNYQRNHPRNHPRCPLHTWGKESFEKNPFQFIRFHLNSVDQNDDLRDGLRNHTEKNRTWEISQVIIFFYCIGPQQEVVCELASSTQWSFDVSWCPRNPAVIASASFDGRVSVYSLMGGQQQVSSWC